MSEAVNHPSDLELDSFLNRAASVSGLADVGRHLAECAQCRTRAEARSKVDDRFAALYRQVALAAPEEHLSAEDVQVLAQGGPLPNAAAHMEKCQACRAEVDDLKQFIAARERPQSFRARYWIPIAALIVAGVSVIAWRAAQPVSQMPSDYAQMVARARSSGHLEVAPAIAALGRSKEQLLGDLIPGSGFSLIHPVNEAAISDRPQFSWSALPGAAAYRVNIYDENFGKVAESPEVSSTSWTPAQALDPSHTYSWTVTAHVGKREIREPVPPSPEARFKVLGANQVAELREAEQKYPNDHLLLAALYAKAGALEDARRELKALAAGDPESDLPRRLANSLDGRQ